MLDGKTCVESLDDFALLMCQKYNFGNANNWFLSFRKGMQGYHSRVRIVETHRALMFEWVPGAGFGGLEANMAICLFAMDSAIECFVFALNAIGNAADGGFRDVGNEAALKRISITDITGNTTRRALPGYEKVFPKVQEHFVRHGELVRLIQDNHEVTKHRQSGFTGSTSRADPPPGFFQSMGIDESHPHRFMIAPQKSIMLPKHPKLPVGDKPRGLSEFVGLEELIAQFYPFLEGSVSLALHDVRTNIALKVTSLIRT